MSSENDSTLEQGVDGDQDQVIGNTNKIPEKRYFTSTNFHDLSTKKRIVPMISPENNSILLFNKSDENETGAIGQGEPVCTDMIKGMKLYVRINLNVQLLNYTVIDLLVDDIKKEINEYIKDLDLTNQILDTPESLVSFNGPSYSNMKVKQKITMWITVDIPYIIGNIPRVNEYINKITSIYKEYCEKSRVTGTDVFYIAKFVVKTIMYYSEDSFSLLMIANYQKPNAYVKSSEIHINIPKGVNIIGNIPENDTRECKIVTIKTNEEDGVIFTETVFDDRIRFNEISVQRFVEKGEKFIMPNFTTRTIMIMKSDKNRPLIHYENGVITVAGVRVIINEHPKTTALLMESVSEFLSSNTVLSGKPIKLISQLFGRNTIHKLNMVFN